MVVLYYFHLVNLKHIVLGEILMADGEWEIHEIRMMGTCLVLRVPAVPNLKPLPGQYFQVFAPGCSQTAAVSLFLAGGNHDSLDLTGEIPSDWNPGKKLRWRGPLGHGFELPAKVEKTAFVPWLNPGLVLLPLLEKALGQQAAVTWYSRQVPDWLPPQVEVLPPESLPDAVNWAEYIAITCDLKHLSDLTAALGGKPTDHPKCRIEVLVHTPLVCGGSGACGVCSVKIRRGWKLACKDGPVFALEQLEV